MDRNEVGRVGQMDRNEDLDPDAGQAGREALVDQDRDRVGQAQQDPVDRQTSKQFNSRYV